MQFIVFMKKYETTFEFFFSLSDEIVVITNFCRVKAFVIMVIMIFVTYNLLIHYFDNYCVFFCHRFSVVYRNSSEKSNVYRHDFGVRDNKKRLISA